MRVFVYGCVCIEDGWNVKGQAQKTTAKYLERSEKTGILCGIKMLIHLGGHGVKSECLCHGL